MTRQQTHAYTHSGTNLVFCLAASLLAMIFWTYSATQAAAPNKDWILHQRSDYLGQQTLYLSPQGMKITSRALSTIVMAPACKVMLFNDKIKSFFECDYNEWTRKYAGPPPGAGRTIQKGKTALIGGIRATQYFFENFVGGKRRITEEYWAACDSSLPAKVVEAVDKVSNFPPGLGIPLRIFKVNDNGSRLTALDTLSCQRAAVPPTMFKAPVGYQRVKDPMTLFWGLEGSADKQIDELLK